MPPFEFLALGALFLAVAGLFWYLQWKRDQQRTRAFQALARERGWQFTERDRDADERYRGFAPFDKGKDRFGRWLLRGQADEVPFELFTYHYEVTRQSGKHSHTDHYWHRVCCLEMPIDSPGLTIRDEHVGHKLFDALGGEDLDFESDAFSRRFWVKAEDRRFGYDVIHTEVMDYLLERPGWVWQWKGRRLVVYDTSGKLDAADCDRLLSLALGLRERLPRHLVAEG